MNSKSRMLPHLNICYLQKKAYDAHRKKIDSIKQSLRSSLAKKLGNMSENYSLDGKLTRKDSIQKMSTIKQEVSESKLIRMRPLNRKKYFEQIKENQRLFKRIQTCESTINRKIIENHKLRSQQYKNRISKFKSDPKSHKSLLKSQHSLQILQKLKVKQKYKQFQHFFNQNIEPQSISIIQIQQKSKSMLSKFQNADSPKVKTQIRQPRSKNQSISKLMARRNSQKIQNHFDKQEFQFKPTKKFSVLRQESNRTGTHNRSHTEDVSSFWKSRCFTTQPSNYQ